MLINISHEALPNSNNDKVICLGPEWFGPKRIWPTVTDDSAQDDSAHLIKTYTQCNERIHRKGFPLQRIRTWKNDRKFHSNQILNQLSSKCRIQWVSNSIRILNGVKMSCRNATLSRGKV